jgi:glutamyl-tRNA reductase
MKELLVVGISHKTAPVEWRERLCVPEDRLPGFLKDLKNGSLPEAVVLSTCNRLEVYAAASSERDSEFLQDRLTEWHGDSAIRPSLYAWRHDRAFRHLFRVASGLESLVVGESEILGQVKRAYEGARTAGSTGKLTNVVFQRALFVGKVVRARTAISEGPTSTASVAVALAQRIFGDLRDNRVLLVGAGKMAELSARSLLHQNVGALAVVNRTLERAREMASRFHGRAAPFQDLLTELAAADVAICSTGSPEPVLRHKDVAQVMHQRRGRPLFLIDIAVPRDVEPSVHRIQDVYLYNIDDLKAIVQDNLAKRLGKIEAAEALVEEKTVDFARWYQAWTQGQTSSLKHSGREDEVPVAG